MTGETLYSKGPLKEKIADRMILFLVLRFWDKNTMAYGGAMSYRRDFPATTMIQALQAKKGMLLPATLFLAWLAHHAPGQGGGGDEDGQRRET